MIMPKDEFLEQKNKATKALQDALPRYPVPNRYSATILYGRDWPSVTLSYPQYADAELERAEC